MDLEMDVKDEAGALDQSLDQSLDRLLAAAAQLEAAAVRLGTLELEAAAGRVEQLEARLREAEATVASLRAAGRRAGSLVAKEGDAPGGVDLALASLPVEQRIAVKAQLLRSGLL